MGDFKVRAQSDKRQQKGEEADAEQSGPADLPGAVEGP